MVIIHILYFLNQTSDTIELDLKTYGDLEALRSHKSGINIKSKSVSEPANMNRRRYLIMTYTVEFDRYVRGFSIHSSSLEIFRSFILIYNDFMSICCN